MSRSVAPALVRRDDILESDRAGEPVDARGRQVFLERFIHSAICRVRPDVQSVVHTHSPAVISFSVSQVPTRATFLIDKVGPCSGLDQRRRAGGPIGSAGSRVANAG
jgi:ribulose-5-phosphate 4-epimerase/fuculose-1-phosphate aldolase